MDNSALLNSILATLLVSIIPFLILFTIYALRTLTRGYSNNSNKSSPLLSDALLKVFVSFAIGGLLGDALLHLIPHSLNPHNTHSHQHAPVSVSVSVPVPISAPSIMMGNNNGFSSPSSNIGLAASAGLAATQSKQSHSHSHSDHSHSHSHDHDHSHGHSHSHDHSHSDSHDHSESNRVFGLVLLGMFAFYCLEKFARFRQANSGSGAADGHSHGHSHGSHSESTVPIHIPAQASIEAIGSVVTAVDQHQHHDDDHSDDSEPQSTTKRRGGKGKSASATAATTTTTTPRSRGRKRVVDSSPAPVNGKLDSIRSPSRSAIKSKSKSPSTAVTTAAAATSPVGPTESQRLAGLLNLIADVSHNFTDGLAIAASFSNSIELGYSTTLAVLIHEIPHEIGDFAILLQSGYTIIQAMLFQLITAIGALLGVLFAYYTGDINSSKSNSNWILPFTAGGFIYVALVNALPGLLPHTNLKQMAAEMIAMGLGVYLMILIGEFE